MVGSTECTSGSPNRIEGLNAPRMGSKPEPNGKMYILKEAVIDEQSHTG